MILTREEILAVCLALPKTKKDAPFHDPNWDVVRCKSNNKVFAWVYERNGQMYVNVKVSPEWRDFFRSTYASVLPGYHLNKEHWNTILLDGSVPDEAIRRMVAESYDLVNEKAKKRADSPMAKEVYKALRKVPRGRVITYGELAKLSGHPGAARAVGTILHVNPDPDKNPCHRVVSSSGRMAPSYAFGGEEVQAEKLREEGVEVVKGVVDRAKYGICRNE